jgi:hypothetical protein
MASVWIRPPFPVPYTGRLNRQQFLACKKALKAHVKSRACDQVFEAYRTMTGVQELPILGSENQPHFGDPSRDYHTRDMRELSEAFKEAVEERDEADKKAKVIYVSPVAPRRVRDAQKKWLVLHDGSYERGREERKDVSEKVGTALFAYYKADNVSALLRLARDHRPPLNRHDMCDAYLQAMSLVLRMYSKIAQAVLGRRKPHEQRSETPVLTFEQMQSGGTLRVLGLDPGVRNFGFCLLEFTGMEMTGNQTDPMGSEPEPMFRILSMQLIDLYSPYDPVHGHAVLHLEDPDAPVCHAANLPTQLQAIRALAAATRESGRERAAAAADENGTKPKAPRKRKRVVADSEMPEDDAPKPSRRQKKRKVLATTGPSEAPEDDAHT